MTSSQPNPRGVHFVGSAPFSTTDEAFRVISSALPKHIQRLPDGEPCSRGNFVAFQHGQFLPYPQLFNERFKQLLKISSPPPPVDTSTLETTYDTVAIESYKTFTALRSQGVIPPSVRFLVCIPTALNTLASCIVPEYKPLVEPYYTAALRRAVDNIAAAIPHRDLAIQIDCAQEFAMLEGLWKQPGMERFAPW